MMRHHSIFAVFKVFILLMAIMILSPGRASAAVADQARALVITENIDDAAVAYAQLVAKDSNDAVLAAEFAYVLALEGMYDAALIRLDRVRGPGKETATDFFAHEVIALMGYPGLADRLIQGTAPDWIGNNAPRLREKFGRNLPADQRTTNPADQFKRANRLVSQNATLQSLTLFEELIRQFPGEYLFYVGNSIALERSDRPDLAVQSLEAGLTLLKEQPGRETDVALLDKRLATLQQKVAVKAGSGTPKPAIQTGGEIFNPRMMAYAGGFISSSYTSLNGRVGSFFTRTNYATFDFGMTSASGATYANLGFSVYDRQGIFVLGVGMTGSFGEGSSVLYSKISVGPSFMNKKGTASFDIFLDGKVPLKKGYSTLMGLSIGRSFYFGKRK
jgi:tetratricopeptide (TPR) repeat protein